LIDNNDMLHMLHRKPVHIEQHTDDIVFHQHIRFFFWQQWFDENQWELSGIIKRGWMTMDW